MANDVIEEAEARSGLRQRARETRQAARGERILDALATLITRWGYGKTTVDDVAREAGVAKGTVYLHWPTKEAMLQALIEREERQWNDVILERMRADPRGGTISSLYRHGLALSMQNPLLHALFTQDHDALGEWTRSPQFNARAHGRMKVLYALIRQMRAGGLMRDDTSVEVQAYLIGALLYGILTLDEYLPAELVPPSAEIVEGFAALMRRGFEPELVGDEEEQALARGRSLMAGLMASLAAEARQAANNGQIPRQTTDKENRV